MNPTPQHKNHLYKINPLLETFHENINQILYPTRVFVIDKSMVLWIVRLAFRQFIHGKTFVLKCINYTDSKVKVM